MCTDYSSMKNWGGFSIPDYSELHRDCSIACYSYPHIELAPWWVGMGS